MIPWRCSLYQLSYKATHWERGQFIEFISPMRSEMAEFENLLLTCELFHIYFTPYRRFISYILHAISQHCFRPVARCCERLRHVRCCWSNFSCSICGCCVKPRPNDGNMPTQHVATLLGATCCVGMLRSFGRALMLQSFGQARATMLRLGMRTSSIFNSQYVARRCKRWPNACNMLRSVAFNRCDRLASTCN